ncbi:MAG TPA: hypothetical protein VGI76_09845 [Solirubrobacteraceae bacterium]
MRIRVALVVGVTLIAVSLAWTLSRDPQVVASANSEYTHKKIAATTTPAGACQGRETLPQGTSAIRLGLTAVVGPRVTVKVLSGAHLLASGTRAAGWEGGSVTVPLHPAAQHAATAKVCFRISQMNGPVEMLGLRTSHGAALGQEGKRLPGRLHIEYVRPGHESWWSMASATARRLGLGRAAAGSWNALLVLALAATLIALSSWLLTRELR